MSLGKSKTYLIVSATCFALKPNSIISLESSSFALI